ncbi:MAG: LemA family protein [candidate division SR1 bacterium]|nr:LemA family protein [candidate division SR1 bacterium]
MKKSRKVWAIVIVVIVILGFWMSGKYNGLVTTSEKVKTARSQVENVYQRRLDLIPNLVNTVKGAAAQESGVLVAVVQARAQATQTKVDINDAASFAKFQATQGEVSSSLSKLLAVVENYPTLQSIQAYRGLMVQLEGAENRITVERKTFNDTVNTYNIMLRSFPTNIVAGLFGFHIAAQFQADAAAAKVPMVDFTK